MNAQYSVWCEWKAYNRFRLISVQRLSNFDTLIRINSTLILDFHIGVMAVTVLLVNSEVYFSTMRQI